MRNVSQKYVTNIDDMLQRESSVNAKTRSAIDRESSVWRKTKVINSEIRNDKWRAESQSGFSSSLFGESRNGEQTAVKTGISAESIGATSLTKANQCRKEAPLLGSSKMARTSGNDHNRSKSRRGKCRKSESRRDIKLERFQD